jgi:hypothetical protein
VVFLNDPDATVKCVCDDCNSGWMSRLETSARNIIGALSQDISIWLDATKQETIARWTLKTAMVFESLTPAERIRCYGKPERQALRLALPLPPRTRVWIGRYSESGLGAFGTDIWTNIHEVPKAGNGCGTTFVIGHLIIQILTLHVPPEYEDGIFSININPVTCPPKTVPM